MCGIFGIYDQRNINNLKKCKLGLKIINYRGPDDSKIIQCQNFVAGTNRLAIEALKDGIQPVETEKYVLGFNGEIFNYKYLTKKYQFPQNVVNSEAKLLINLWMKKKLDFIQDIEGQFSIFIFDKEKKITYLIRDRFGIRPLFYYYNKYQLFFGSEAKSIISSSDEDFEIDAKSLAQIAMFWTNIGKQTSFKNIYSVKPGHYIEFKNGIANEKKYFFNPILNEKYINVSTKEIKKELVEQLKNSVKRQGQSEVGYACYVSGGIDSSIIAYLLSQEKKIDTFSIEFEDNEYNERDAQQQIIKNLNTKHNSLSIKKKDIANNFSKVIYHCESLLFRTAPVPLYLLSKLVKESGHKVVYTGEGADEILFGYDLFFENRIRNFWKKDPTSKIRPLLFKKLYHYLPQFNNPRYFALIKEFYSHNLLNDDKLFYSHLVRWAQYDQVSSYFNLEINKNELFEDIKLLLPENFSTLSSDTKAQQIEIETLLSNYLLSSQGDRMSMANSVEGRYPYLDDKFTNFCSSINPNLKANGLSTKKLLRDSFDGLLPDKILKRPKVAYQAPEAQSFIGEDYTSEIFKDFRDSLKKLDLINEKNFLGLVDKIRNPYTSKRLGFRENVAFIIGLSYFSLINSVKAWKNFK